MPSIDERVVSMAFDNVKFEAGVAQTMASLQKLDASLQKVGTHHSLAEIEKAANKVTLEAPASALDKLKAKLHFGRDASEGFGEIEKAGNKVTLDAPAGALDKFGAKLTGVGAEAADAFGNVEKASNQVTLEPAASAIDGLAHKFGALEVAAVAALGTIVSKMTMMSGAAAKGFTVAPIMKGYKEYELKLNSVQTILANTQASGATLKDVTGALNELNHYADKTIYNFGQMAKNIGTFTAAGVDLDTATASIKGIANLAALSGTNSEQASRAMYQLSQAISAGRVSLMDWKSVENAGMGGAVFQRNLAETAVAMGILDKSAVKLTGKMKNVTINGESFRSSIMAKPGQESWLSSKVLTSSLENFTGDLTDAELAAKGFSEAQVKAIRKQAETAVDAATKVKTFTQLVDTTKESIESGWAETFEIIFGDFNEAKKLWSGVAKSIGDFVQRTTKARNHMLEVWDKLGGRTKLFEGIGNAFKAIFAIIKQVTGAFRDIFPPTTGKGLFEMTKRFAEFTKGLMPSKEVLEGLRRTARGFFAVLHIGWNVVKGVIGVIGDLLGVVGKGGGSFLNFTGGIGDFLVAVDEALTKGGLLTGFFDGLSAILKVPLEILSSIATAIFGLFGGMDTDSADKFGESLGKVGDTAAPLEALAAKLKAIWQDFLDILEKVGDIAAPIIETVKEGLSGLGSVLSDAFENVDMDRALQVLQTGFIGGIFLAIKNGLTGFGGGGGILGSINETFKALTGHLTAMQNNVRASMILKIAAAIGILALGVALLSTIDSNKLATAMTAIAVGLGQLVAALALLSKFSGGAAFIALPAIAGAMVLLAGSVLILAGAMKIFATMSWEDLAKGLAGVAGSLGAIAAGMKLLGPGTIVQALPILALAVALNILALAVKQFASLDWEDLGKGLLGVAGALAAIAVPMMLFGPSTLLIGPGLIGVAFAMTMLAAAVRSFGEMDPKKLGIGILGVGLALASMGAAINLIPPTVALQAAGLVILAIALQGIAAAIKVLGGMSIGGLLKGLIGLGGALVILAVGLMAMTGTLPGAAALLAAAAGLALLAPVLAFLGTLEWGTIFKGLAAMALALGTLAVAGALAAPGISALGVALLPLAGVLVLTAGATFLFAKALALLGGEGTKGIGIMVAAITAFIALIPKIVIEFVKGLVEIVKQIAIMAPGIATSLVKIANTLLDAFIELIPKLGEVVGTLLGQMLVIIEQHAVPIFQAGLRLFMEFLRGIGNNIGQIVQAVSQIITRFLNQMTIEAPRIIASGAKMLVSWLQGFRQHLGKVVTAAFEVANKFLTTVANQIPRFIQAGANVVVKFLNGLASQLPRMIRAGTNVIVGFLNGIQDAIPRVVIEAHQTIRAFLRAIGDEKEVRRTVRTGLNAAINFVNGITLGLRDSKFIEKLADAAYDLGKEIARQFLNGLRSLAEDIQEEILGFALTRDYEEYEKQQQEIHDREIAAIKARGKEGKSTGRREMKEVGRASGDGHIQGIVEKSPEVEEATRRSVRRAIRGARREAGIKSPSTEFKHIGQFMVEGMKEGLQGLPGTLEVGVIHPLQAMLKLTKDSRKIGRFLGSDFAKGLAGSKDEIEAAFDGLKEQFKSSQAELRGMMQESKAKVKDLKQGDKENDKAIEEARKVSADLRADYARAKNQEERNDIYEQIIDADAELNKLIKGGQKNEAKIREATRMVANRKDLLVASQMATRNMMRDLADEKAALLALADSYDVVMARLAEVKEFLKATKDQYMQTPDFNVGLDEAMAEMDLTVEEREEKRRQKVKEAEKRARIDQVFNYKQALAEQIRATEEYNKTLEKLREAGLDDATYKKLLAQGVSGQDFASQLLAGGKAGIAELNELNKKLEVAAENLSQDAADQLFAAGVHAAEGIVKGLESQAAAIKGIMNAIAQDMVNTIKSQLKIKSPSQIFARLGEFTGQGLVNGMRSTSNAVAAAAGSLGNDAARAMQESLDRVADVVGSEVDSNLTVTPVLDLTQVETEARRMAGLFESNVVPIEAAASYGQASAISSETQATRDAQAEAAAAAAPTVIFEQNNMSPDKLSEIEIYRQTNNQLAQLKSVLPGLVPA